MSRKRLSIIESLDKIGHVSRANAHWVDLLMIDLHTKSIDEIMVIMHTVSKNFNEINELCHRSLESIGEREVHHELDLQKLEQDAEMKMIKAIELVSKK
jgi:hypothetical protein